MGLHLQSYRQGQRPPTIVGMFYQAMVASVLMYGNEMWVAPSHNMRSLEGFNVA